MDKIIVIVENGMVQDVLTSLPGEIDIDVLDLDDTEDYDAASVIAQNYRETLHILF